MNHFNISLLKSALRIIGSIITIIIHSIIVLAIFYGIAEILGILEELFDKRKEN